MPAPPIIRILEPGDKPALLAFLQEHAETSQHLLAEVRLNVAVPRPVFAACARGNIIGILSLATPQLLMVQCPDLVRLEELFHYTARHRPPPVMALMGPRPQIERLVTLLGGEALPFRLNNTEQVMSMNTAELVCPPKREPFVVREAEPADLEQLYGWRTAFLNEVMHLPLTQALVEQVRADIDGQATANHLFVMDSGGELLGMIQVVATDDTVVQLGGAYVPPHLRGKGYSCFMLAGMVELLRGAGVTRVSLFSTKRHTALNRAALRVGFRHDGDFGLVMFNTPVQVG